MTGTKARVSVNSLSFLCFSAAASSCERLCSSAAAELLEPEPPDSAGIACDETRIEEWLGSELRAAIGSDVEVEWVADSASEGESGIVAVHVMTPSGVVCWIKFSHLLRQSIDISYPMR